MVLEQIQDSNNKTFFVVNLDTNDTEFTIGRGNERDIRVGEISVSRLHCSFIKTAENTLYIYDKNSKFGTLIKV